MSSATKDRPLEDCVWHMGMRLIQRACAARVAGDNAAAEAFQRKFFDLCEAIQKKPLKEVVHRVQDDVMVSLRKTNDSRLELLKEYHNVRTVLQGQACKPMAQAVVNARRSCEILTSCLEKEIPPPALETRTADVEVPVLNADIGRDEIRVTIHGVDGPTAKGRNYVMFVYPPVSSPDPRSSGKFQPGPVDAEFTFKSVDRKNVQRFLRRCVVLELRVHQSKAFGRVDVFSAASVKIPMSLFQGVKEIHKQYVMTNNPEASTKEDTFSVDVTLSLHSPLVNPETEERSFQYIAIASGAKIVKPQAAQPQQAQPAGTTIVKPSKPLKPGEKRTIQELEPSERSVLAALLKSLKLPPAWELQRFSSLSILKMHLTNVTPVVEQFKAFGVDIPANIIQTYETLVKRQTDLLNALKSKRVSIQQYKDLLKKQAETDAAEAKTKGLQSPDGQILLTRITLMKDEFKKMQPNQ